MNWLSKDFWIIEINTDEGEIYVGFGASALVALAIILAVISAFSA